MNENEMLTASEEVVENVETTTNQTNKEPASEPAEKTFTQSELNKIVSERLKRNEQRLRKEYDREYGDKYSELESVLAAGTGEKTVEGMTNKFRAFYEGQGVEIPQGSVKDYSDSDLTVLAEADAREVINSGYDDISFEIERLSQKSNSLSPREKAQLKILKEEKTNQDRRKKLSELGVSSDVYLSEDYKNYREMFKDDVSEEKVYKMYAAQKPQHAESPGSMKNGSHEEEKTYYSPEDVDKLTSRDLDNPVIFKRVRESMQKW